MSTIRAIALVLVVALVAMSAAPRALAKTPPVKAPPETAAIAAVVDAQFAGFRDTKATTAIYAPNAMIAMTGGTASPQVNKLTHADGKWSVFGPATVGKHKLRDLRVVVARDGKTAWASFAAKVAVDGLSATKSMDVRATELFVSTKSGWQVASGAWSLGVTSAAFAKAAKAKTFKALETVFDQNLGDRDVIAALKALAIDGKTARADLASIGTAPTDRTIGGKLVATKLGKDKLVVAGSVWAISAGTTACATANVELTRGTATIPARLFAVFEKSDGGAWEPVLLHLAAAAP